MECTTLSKGSQIKVTVNGAHVTATVYAVAIGKAYWTYTDAAGAQTIGWVAL